MLVHDKKNILANLIKNLPKPDNIRSKTKIVTFPGPSLALPSLICDLEHQREYWILLVKYMCNAMIDHGGIGLAAPQIGCNVALCVLSRTLLMEYDKNHLSNNTINHAAVDNEGRYDQDGEFFAIFNPEIKYLSSDADLTSPEGCLSLPMQGRCSQIKRKNRIHLAFTTIDNKQYTSELRDISSIVMQHEIDHLYGILYLARIEDKKLLGTTLDMYCKLNMINKGDTVTDILNVMLENTKNMKYFKSMESMRSYAEENKIDSSGIMHLTDLKNFFANI